MPCWIKVQTLDLFACSACSTQLISLCGSLRHSALAAWTLAPSTRRCASPAVCAKALPPISKLAAATIRGNHRTDLESEMDIIDARLSPLESVAGAPSAFNDALYLPQWIWLTRVRTASEPR